MATMDHSLESGFYDRNLYNYSGPAYGSEHHSYAHHNPQNIPNVSHIGPSSNHHRRDSNMSLRLDHSQLPQPAQHPPPYAHHTQSPPMRQQQHHQMHQQSLNSRPRSTSATTVDHQNSSAALLHESRSRAHTFADPRSAADNRLKQNAVIDEVAFTTNAPVPEVDEEPLYVNAKQYHRILKRRLARARLAEIQKLSTQRKPYLHQSRHNHAVRRPRGPGGRFLTAEEIAARKANGQNDGEEAGHNESSESPMQESASTPREEVTSPTQESNEKSSRPLGVAYSYPASEAPATIAPSTAPANGETNGISFNSDSLGSILGDGQVIGINGNYNYGGVHGSD